MFQTNNRISIFIISSVVFEFTLNIQILFIVNLDIAKDIYSNTSKLNQNLYAKVDEYFHEAVLKADLNL